MADESETTPFLTDNDHHQDTAPVQHAEDDVVKASFPVSAYFKRPVKIVMICVSLLSGVNTMILITAFVILQVGPFKGYIYGADYAIQALGITSFVSLILSTLLIFLQLPIFISFIIDLILAILILIYAGNIFGGGWLKSEWCPNYYRPGYPNSPDAHCRHLAVAVKVLVGISSGIGLLIGSFYIVLLSLRVIAVSRSRSWGQSSICNSGKHTSIFPEGEYTLQFTLKGLKKAVTKTSSGDGSVGGQSGLGDQRQQQQLIDT